jgi:uncharacterized membrane protein YcaP (DUF421 family)
VDAVIRATVIYLFLLLVFRITGKRSLAEITTFDFVLLLIISEATQQGLLGDDFSVLNALLVVTTLVVVELVIGFFAYRFHKVDTFVNGTPLVIVEHGTPLRELMDRARVDDAEVLEAARRLQGLERMEQVKYAILERNGGITIIPA